MANKKTACYLFSKANYPISIKYDGKDLIVPPNAIKFLLSDESKVGALPKNIRKVLIKEDK